MRGTRWTVVVRIACLGLAVGAACRSSSASPCEGVSCSDQGICFSVADAPYCECQRGYHPEALLCMEDEAGRPCEGVTCDDHGSCREEGGLPFCDCEAGYEVYGRLHCIAPLGLPDGGIDDGGADDAEPPAWAVIESLEASPTAVDFGGSVTLTVRVRSVGPAPLAGARIVIESSPPSGAGVPEAIEGVDVPVGETLPFTQTRGPLSLEGSWTFFATLYSATGEELDAGPAAGVTVTVSPEYDWTCACGWFRPSCSRSSLHPGGYVWSWHCWENDCGHCHRSVSYATSTPERFVHCTNTATCGMNFCGVCGYELRSGSTTHLTPCDRPPPPSTGPPS